MHANRAPRRSQTREEQIGMRAEHTTTKAGIADITVSQLGHVVDGRHDRFVGLGFVQNAAAAGEREGVEGRTAGEKGETLLCDKCVVQIQRGEAGAPALGD